MGVRIFNYGNYSSSNYGSCRAVQVGRLTLYYSYETVVAFEDDGTGMLGDKPQGLVVRKNDWGPTTGKHLNWIDNGRQDARLDGEEFEKRLNDVLCKHRLT